MSAERRYRSLRRRIPALAVCAAAMAGMLAVAPLLAGGGPEPEARSSFLNAVETGGFDHNRAHLSASPRAKAEAVADAAACETPAAAGSPFCPAPAPTRAEAAAIRAAGANAGPLGSTQPNGLWGPLLHIPTTAIHAVVLPTNKVLYFSQPKYPAEDETTDGGNAHLWDPATNVTTTVTPPVVDYPTGPDRPANLWCGGQAQLADGRVLVVGGNLEYPANGGNGAGNGFKGGPWVMTFDSWTEQWTAYQDMPHGRWYPTLTELPDGRVLIVGGWDETGGIDDGGPSQPPLMVNDQDVEVFDPAAPAGSQATTVVSQLPPNGPGQPSPWPNHTGIGLYPHMFVLPSTSELGAGGDKVLVAGPGKYDSAVIDTATWVWTDVVDAPDVGQARLTQDRSWGTAWLEPAGVEGSDRVVLLGGTDAGGAAPGPGTAPPPSATAETLDLDDADAGWTPGGVPSLLTGRSHFNTVLLPDGSIFSNGGGYGRKSDTLYAEPVYQAELLTPGAGAWIPAGSEQDARTYHSTSVLLPDGRVASAGDDRDIASAISADHLAVGNRTAQIWSPPYLFDGPRPAITFAPGSVRYDAPFRVAVEGDPAAVTRAVLIRPAAVTHSVDMAQRMITLDVSAQADGLTMRTPLDASVAPPGYYMLFVMNASGVPSVASWVRLDPAAPDAPALPVAPAAPPSADTPVPAPDPTPAARLRLTRVAVGLSGHGARLRLTVGLRASGAGRARITLLRAGARPVTAKTVRLRAGVIARPGITFRRAALRGARKVTVRIVVTPASGRRATARRTLSVPRPALS